MRQAVLQQFLPWIFLVWWVVFVFRGWYVLSYTKLWELARLVTADKEQQLQILHPTGEMARLLELKAWWEAQYPEQNPVIYLPQSQPQFPLSTNIPILRAVLFPWQVAQRLESVGENEVLLLLQPQTGQETRSLVCEKGERCPCWGDQEAPRDTVCWYGL